MILFPPTVPYPRHALLELCFAARDPGLDLAILIVRFLSNLQRLFGIHDSAAEVTLVGVLFHLFMPEKTAAQGEFQRLPAARGVRSAMAETLLGLLEWCLVFDVMPVCGL